MARGTCLAKLGRVITLAVFTSCLHVALAAPQVGGQPKVFISASNQDLQVGLRAAGELWQDEKIMSVYKSGCFSGSGFVTYGVWRFVAAEVEVGYSRTPTDTEQTQVYRGYLELLPISMSALARRGNERAEAFAGVGYAMTVFNDRAIEVSVSGAKPGLDLRGGVRIHTGLVQQSLRPGPRQGLRGVDVELMLARRQHWLGKTGSGFDLSAWRAGLGIVARL